MIKVHLGISNRHLLPLLLLFAAGAITDAPGREFGCGWWSATFGCLSLVAVGVAPFYIVLVCVNLFAGTWATFAKALFSSHDLSRFLPRLFAILTYFFFACRVALISAVEAIFLMIMLSLVARGRVDVFNHPSWAACWWYSLTASLWWHTHFSSGRILGRRRCFWTGMTRHSPVKKEKGTLLVLRRWARRKWALAVPVRLAR